MDREPRHWPGVGTGKFTVDKLMCVDGWLDMLTKMSWGVLQKNEYMPRQYTVIDLNAGPGRYLLSDGRPVDGTPLLILRRLADSRFQTWRAAFVERNAAMADALRAWLADEGAKLSVDPDRYSVLEGDHTSVLMPWVKMSVPPSNGLGLVLHDPNGAPNLALLEAIVREPHLKKFDVAVYVQATSLKRVLNLPEQYDKAGWLPLDEALRRVKAHWVVRTPTGSNQYALCVGSNGRLPGYWSKQHFWPSDSERGHMILEKLTFTAGQRQRLVQPAGLFDDL